jgi:hypothetical protein
VDAEGALLHDSLGSRSVAEVVGVGLDLLGRDSRVRPVEVARPVGAGGHAAAAADAPVVVDDRDAVRLLPGRLHRTDLDAGWVAALLAGHGHVEGLLLRYQLRLVVGVRFGQVDAGLLLHPQHPDPVDLRVAGLVVLVDTGVDAAPAADAARDVETVAELHPIHGRRVAHRDLTPVALRVLPLELGQDLRLALRAQLDEATAQHSLHESG